MYWLSVKGDSTWGTLRTDSVPRAPSPLRTREAWRPAGSAAAACSPRRPGSGSSCFNASSDEPSSQGGVCSKGGDSEDLGRFAQPTQNYVMKCEASSLARLRAASRPMPSARDYPRSLTPDRRGADNWPRSPQRGCDPSEAYLRANDPQPFYDWGEAWNKTQSRGGAGSHWSRERSVRTAPDQWEARLLQQSLDGAISGKPNFGLGSESARARSVSADRRSVSPSTRRASPAAAAAAAAAPPRPIPVRGLSGRAASASGQGQVQGQQGQVRGAPEDGAGKEGRHDTSQLLQEWKNHKQEVDAGLGEFHLAHAPWPAAKPLVRTTFGTSVRPSSKRSPFHAPLWRKPGSASATSLSLTPSPSSPSSPPRSRNASASPGPGARREATTRGRPGF